MSSLREKLNNAMKNEIARLDNLELQREHTLKLNYYNRMVSAIKDEKLLFAAANEGFGSAVIIDSRVNSDVDCDVLENMVGHYTGYKDIQFRFYGGWNNGVCSASVKWSDD